MGKNHYEGKDAVRHVIRSHNSMLISMPQEISIRAGLQRGVDVRVDQDPKKPNTITIEVINPADRKDELKSLLAERKARADKKAAADKKRADAAKKAESKKKEKTKKAAEPKTPEAEKEPEAKTPKKPTGKNAAALLEASKTKAEEMGIHPDQIQPEWRPGDAVILEPAKA